MALLDYLPPRELNWDVVSGIAIGALNGAIIAIFEPGKEKELKNYLHAVWLLSPDYMCTRTGTTAELPRDFY